MKLEMISQGKNEVVFSVTAFQNLGSTELVDSKLGKPISTIPSEVFWF